MERFIWVINITDKTVEDICVHSLQKFMDFPPGRPVQIPLSDSMQLVKMHNTFRVCDNPERYFNVERPQKILLHRDGGIGDLLLMEPLIRKLKSQTAKQISVLSMNPDVFMNHPDVVASYKARTKEDVIPVRFQDFDSVVDFRNYSEHHPKRASMHRSDIYGEKMGIDLSEWDREPRLYFSEDEKNLLFKKEEGKTYIGIQCDASHSYRKFDGGAELVKYFLNKDPRYCVVILGGWNYVKANINESNRFIDLQGRTTVRQMINVVRDLDYLIATDSGIMHVGLSMHVPTVCLFSIITPDLRIRYYMGPKVAPLKDIPCLGCGNEHMAICKYGDKKSNPLFIPPCMNWTPEEIHEYMVSMPLNPERRTFKGSVALPVQPVPEPVKKVNIIEPKKKLTLPIIVQNEEKNLPRFIELVMSNPYIGKVIAIDGGSTDGTVPLLEKAGAQVYVHPYDVGFHDMQAMQRNYSCAFVPDGTNIIIMDIDECFSKALEDYLPYLCESHDGFIQLSRRTFDFYADITDPKKQIKNFPDWQPRVFCPWRPMYKWYKSPHHIILNAPTAKNVDKPIIHFEKEGKDRAALEAKWDDMWRRTKEYCK